MNITPNGSIQTGQESADPRLSGDIKYVYISKEEVFLILKIQH